MHGNKIINLGRLYIYNAVNKNNKRRTSVGATQKEKIIIRCTWSFITSTEKVGEHDFGTLSFWYTVALVIHDFAETNLVVTNIAVIRYRVLSLMCQRG